jgi:hypothetical protein
VLGDQIVLSPMLLGSEPVLAEQVTPHANIRSKWWLS